MYNEDPIPALKQQVGALLARELAGWRRWDIAQWIGTEAPRVTDIRKGRLRRFSLETLIRYAVRLGYRAELTFTRRRFDENGAKPTRPLGERSAARRFDQTRAKPTCPPEA